MISRHWIRYRIVAWAPIACLAVTPILWAQGNHGVQINTDALGRNIPDDAANEPSFAISAVDPDTMVVGWRQFDTITSDVRYAGFGFSSDGGKTWTNGGILERPSGSGVNANQSDPILAADAAGVFFYNSLIFRSQRDGMVVYRSTTSGSTWEAPIYMVEGFRDKNWYTIDRTGGMGHDHHYSIWQLPGEFIRSTDGGQTWENPLDIGARIMGYVHVGREGEVYVGWWDRSRGVRVRRSDNAQDPNQTPSFNTGVNVPVGSLPWSLPVNPAGASGQVYVETDQSDGPRRGWVYLLCSAVTNTDITDVMFARSTDGGQSFTAPIRVNDDNDPQGIDYQWMAAMSVAPGGRIDAVWFDTRDDPNHRLSRLYYSYSYDAGDTWSVNRPLTDQFDSRVGWPVQQKMGDYHQCLSDNGGVNVVHAATFNGEQDLYFNRAHPIELSLSPLQAGQIVQITISGAVPSSRLWLAFSLTGEGRTHIPVLDVDLEIDRPRQAGTFVTADAGGNVQWSLNVPGGTTGRDVWMQAAQFNNASNVVMDTIR